MLEWFRFLRHCLYSSAPVLVFGTRAALVNTVRRIQGLCAFFWFSIAGLFQCLCRGAGSRALEVPGFRNEICKVVHSWFGIMTMS